MMVPFDPRYDPIDMELLEEPEDPFAPDRQDPFGPLADPWAAYVQAEPVMEFDPLPNIDPGPEILDMAEAYSPDQADPKAFQSDLMDQLEQSIENSIGEPVPDLPDIGSEAEEFVVQHSSLPSRSPLPFDREGIPRAEHHPKVKSFRPRGNTAAWAGASSPPTTTESEGSKGSATFCLRTDEAVSQAECEACEFHFDDVCNWSAEEDG